LDTEEELHFIIVCPKLVSPRQKLFEKIISVVPSFSDLSETEKLNLIFSSNDYDINKICVKGVSDMYNYRNAILDKNNYLILSYSISERCDFLPRRYFIKVLQY
jgi:hypothetical protein